MIQIKLLLFRKKKKKKKIKKKKKLYFIKKKKKKKKVLVFTSKQYQSYSFLHTSLQYYVPSKVSYDHSFDF